MMSLRLREGFDKNRHAKLILNPAFEQAISPSGLGLMTTLGLLHDTPTAYRLTPHGWPLLDTVLKEILNPDAH